jgi:hypothetical protein
LIFGRKSVEREGAPPLEFVLIGLSDENIRVMREGKPLSVGPVPADAPLANIQVILTCGETEGDMVVALKKVGLINPETDMNELL